MATTDAQRPGDSDTRRRALDPGGSFIVQAPAGSGKTGLLVQRFLALLAHVERPEEVLALTFTRKAAGEMRHRILGALERAAREPAPEAAHERRTWELARDALAADEARGWDLRFNPGRLRIQTIDALCAALTRQMPVLSTFGAPPGIVEDAAELYHEAARQTIDELESGARWSPAVAHLLAHLDNDLGKVESLLAAMLSRRDQWLRHTVDVRREELERGLRYVVAEALAALRAGAPAAAVDELIALARYAAGNVAEDSPIAACRERDALPGGAPEEIDAWRGLAELLLTRDGEWRKPKGINVRVGFPAPGKAPDAEARARCQDMKARMTDLMSSLAEEDEFRRRLHAVRELPPARYDDEQWETVSALLELLQVAAATLEVVFQTAGEVDFTRVAQAAVRALGDPERPTDLALALDYRIRHILVDEFQDTSLSQYELLERLTAGWEPGDGRTLFAVGDPMQSIYRFREAEVGLFLRSWREGLGGLRLEPLQLEVNFRSQQGIVDWVNEAFAQVMPPADDIGSGAVSYARCAAHHPALAGAAVTVHPFLDNDPAAEAEVVAGLVEAARRDAPDGTAAILVRSRRHLVDIVARLKAAGLRFRAVEIEHLGHRPVVQDLLALTLALTHPSDRIAWLAVLRAPWCGLPLSDLHVLAGDDRDLAIWDAMHDEARLARLGDDGRARLQRVREVLARSVAERGRRPLRRRVEGAWIALGGPACVPDRTDLEDARIFLELLDEVGEGGDLVAREVLMEKMDTLYALPDLEADDTLQIMTIHKSKGLEFDTVIVPGLGRSGRPPEPRLLMWLERPRGHDESDLLLAPIRESGTEHDPIYNYIAGLDRQKERYEQGRLLYVAATRAQRRLHLLGHTRCEDDGEVRAPSTGTLLQHLWPVVAPVFEAAAARAGGGAGTAVEEEAAGETTAPPLQRLVPEWHLPPPPPSVRAAVAAADAERVYPAVEFVWAGETARHVGTVLHRFLQQWARQGTGTERPPDEAVLARTAEAALASLGVPAGQREGAVGKVLEGVRRTLEDTRGRWILDPSHGEARCEYTLTGRHRGERVTGSIDRTFVDADGVRWIIDYKTGSHEGGGVEEFLDREQERYRAQLERYAALLSQAERRPIRLGLYFPLLGGWREWAWGGEA